jgi:hypothetical protein
MALASAASPIEAAASAEGSNDFVLFMAME